MGDVHFANTQYGFEYGAAKVTRICSDPKEGWVIIDIATPKHEGHDAVQVYVTKTGKVRVYKGRKELL